MARLVTRTVSTPASGGATSSTAWIPLNHHVSPFNVGFGLEVVTASAQGKFSVQHTFDDILAGASANVWDHSEVSGTAQSMDGNYAYPVMAVRLSIVSGGSAASQASLWLLQSDT